jgi:hypothetical protein
MTVYALPFQVDLKIKSSGIGGFSDGGVKCLRRDLKISTPFVDVGPTPGKSWRSFELSALATASGSICIANFGLTTAVDITESVLLEDGTVLPPSIPATTISAGSIQRIAASVFAGDTLGGILSYPNKLRYRLAATSGSPPVAPSGRVLLMILVMELDQLKDE